MTNNELLDAILNSYLYAISVKYTNPALYRKMTFENVAKAQADGQNFKLDKWHLEFLRKKLLDEGFLEPSKYGNPDPYSLTTNGINFINSGGYSKAAIKRQREEQIQEQTLNSLKRSKTSLYISIFAIIIPTIISVYSLWTSKQSPTTDQIQELQQRIQKIENLKSEAKTIKDSSLLNLADTLKMENSN